MTTPLDSATAAADAFGRRARRIRRRFMLLVVVPLVVACAGVYVYLQGGRYVETDNAYVKADKIPVSAEVAGRVAEVLVRENQPVTAGQMLFRLDPENFRTRVAKAEATLAQARTDLAALKAGYRHKLAEITLARTRLAFAEKDQQRQADLLSRNFVSAAKFDESRQSVDLAAQAIVAMEQDLQRILETLGGRLDAPVDQHPTVRSALAELSQARLDLARADVRASVPGIVNKPPKPGQYMAAGAIAMALVASGELWIEANFIETDLTYVRPDQPVSVRIDTYPGRTWTGVVESLSPATSAEFAVLPAQNATGNWVKIVQRVPIRIRVEPADANPALRAGLSAIVRIDTGHRRRLFGYAL